MVSFSYLLALSSTAAAANIVANIPVSPKSASPEAATNGVTVGQPLDGFVSYSIEFSSFPDFAGNLSKPNTFSNNLLNNLGYVIGTKPYIRVGGNTQDYYIFNSTQKQGLIGTVNATRSPDYPTTISIGPAYFESFETWPGTRFSYGFNLGGNNYSAATIRSTLESTAQYACRTLGTDKLYLYEYGNEPDLYSTASFPVRNNANWTDEAYVEQWLNGTRFIKSVIEEACPEQLSGSSPAYAYMAPSFGGVGNHLKQPGVWEAGLDTDKDIKYASTHNYISGATSPGVTLQGTLMNHTRTVSSIAAHVSEFANITASGSAPPSLVQIFGETNSLYNEGAPGLSNSFGAALWGIDFALYSASVGIGRVHFHQGTNYRYQSWQPIETDIEPKGTKAPYYGNVATAAFLGNLKIAPVRIASVEVTAANTDTNTASGAKTGIVASAAGSNVTSEPISAELDVVYSAYVNDTLARLMVINLRAYNYTLNGTGDLTQLNPVPRPEQTYTFGVELANGTEIGVRRLYANGSDAISGIAWDGVSYNYELANGLPVRLHNITTGETAKVKNGEVQVLVPDSQAVVLDFHH
ncbi:glycoside hydrolase family 79 protein [Xylariaceae sp. FL0255]|nr:glycoside hydrolase family 79 protein [Xylariaceae sp. FL0255]